MRKLAVLAATLLAVLAVALPAMAHVTVQPGEAEAGAFARFVVRVPNERDDAATTRVEVQLPPLAFLSFQPKQGGSARSPCARWTSRWSCSARR